MGGGTGLAPFISYSLHLKKIESRREIVVLHGASYVDELSYRELLTDLEEESLDKGKDKWNFKYRAGISSRSLANLESCALRYLISIGLTFNRERMHRK